VHEYSIVQSLLERVESEARQHEATAVHRIHLRIGELSGVEIDLLDTAFQTFRSGSSDLSLGLDLLAGGADDRGGAGAMDLSPVRAVSVSG
jgi:hypothetical protein